MPVPVPVHHIVKAVIHASSAAQAGHHASNPNMWRNLGQLAQNYNSAVDFKRNTWDLLGGKNTQRDAFSSGKAMAIFTTAVVGVELCKFVARKLRKHP